jgi:hypothetical protein
VWPAASLVPRRWVGGVATGVLLALLTWLAAELGGGSALGLSERVLAGAEALCPLALITYLRRSARPVR